MSEQQSLDLFSLFKKTQGTEHSEVSDIKKKFVETYVEKIKTEGQIKMIQSGDMLKKYLLGTGGLSDLFMEIALGFIKDEKKKKEIMEFKNKITNATDEELKKIEEEKNMESMTSAEIALLKSDITSTTNQMTDNKTEGHTIETTNRGKFETDEIADPHTKILKMIPENFDPTTGQVDIFYCGFGVTIEDQKKIFEENKITANHAIIIVEGDPSHIDRANNPAARYNDIQADAEKFKKELETKIFAGKAMKKICLIGHSGAGTVVNDLTGKLRQQG